jgi:hypothetical protein
LLLLGAGGGAYLADDPARARPGDDGEPAPEALSRNTELDALRRLVEAEVRTDRGVREAVEQAELAAEQRASRADPAQASPPPPAPPPAPAPAPDPEPESGEPAAPANPVPASCNGYSGNRATGCGLLLEAGFGLDQMSCLDNLWTRESGWNHLAQNPSSGAYGIPQALPGDKMATYGDDWRTNPVTQIRWGLSYIDKRYGTPCAAWQHSQATGWY